MEFRRKRHCTLYQMLAGTSPFEGSGLELMMLNMMQDPPSIATRAGIDVDPLLEVFARKLMARDAADRFGSAAEALRALELIEKDRVAAARALGVDAAVPCEIVERDEITARFVRPAPPPAAEGRERISSKLLRLLGLA